MKIKYMHKE